MASKNYFEEKGDQYSKYRPTYPEELGIAVAELCNETHHAFELGCGSGQLSGVLANNFDLVTATDSSIEQINNATPFEKVNYQLGTAENIALADDSADLIIAAQAAHWFDLPLFYKEAKRVTKKDAVIALISYGVMSVKDEEINKLFQQFYWEEIHSFWPPERKHIESGYQSFDFPFIELSLPELFIKREWKVNELLGYIETWSAVRLAHKAEKENIFNTFKLALNDICTDESMLLHIQWPIVGRMGRL